MTPKEKLLYAFQRYKMAMAFDTLEEAAKWREHVEYWKGIVDKIERDKLESDALKEQRMGGW